MSSTIKAELPWERSATSRSSEALHVVIAWSLDEPHRVGEVATVNGRAILGRGGPQPEDEAPRVLFRRVRPGTSDASGPLASQRISRVQLALEARGDELHVKNVGKTPLLHRDLPVKELTATPGDVLVVKNALVLLVSKRPTSLEALRSHPQPAFPFGGPDAHGIVGESPAAWAMRESIAIAARGPHHVLVQGDSGVGKELAARALHALSERSGRAFVSRNAATFPEGLVDAELFGNARNYPHAGSPERPGLLGEADGGTLVLDEIGELPAHLQAHLLRALDRAGEYQRLGEARTRTSDFRLVAMTNRPVESLKHDFAARLASRLSISGLGERLDDVPLLIRHAALDAAKRAPDVVARFVENGVPRIDPRLVEALLLHRWTLHLRELQRLLWSAIAASRGEFIELVPEVQQELDVERRESALEIGEGEIRAALAAHDGNVTRAAKQLGVENRYVLYRLMKKHGIDR
jgi:two-component system nitrogen regulation response regulator GlnG/two-component system response regulator HydG